MKEYVQSAYQVKEIAIDAGRIVLDKVLDVMAGIDTKYADAPNSQEDEL